MTDDAIKPFYASYHDRINDKRVRSPYTIRRKIHQDIYESILCHVPPGATVLDAGCGEGNLSILMAEKGSCVTGIDFSEPNIAAARKYADDRKLASDRLEFRVGDAENLPFEENSFDCVVSNHVLEHLPNFNKGLSEIFRVTRNTALIAVPTCLNPSSWALLGGDNYWRIWKRTVFVVPLGIIRVIAALLVGAEGVNQGYAGRKEIVHVFRFPWRVRRMVEDAGFIVESFSAQSVRIPYIPIPVKLPQSGRLFRYFGIGTLYVVRKPPSSP